MPESMPPQADLKVPPPFDVVVVASGVAALESFVDSKSLSLAGSDQGSIAWLCPL